LNHKKNSNMKFTVTFVLITIANFAIAQGINFESHDAKWADILAKAKAENKVIFMDAYTTWCGPCKKMSADIFPQKEVGDYFNKQFINVKMDMEKGEGLDLAKKYKIRAYPTYLFIDGNGELVHKSMGMMPAPDFINVAQSAADPNKQFFTLKKKFDKGEREPAFVKNLLDAAVKSGENETASEVMNIFMDTQKDLGTKENMDLLINSTQKIDSKAYKYIANNRAAFEKKYEKELVEYRILFEPSNEIIKKFTDNNQNLDVEKAKTFLNLHISKEQSEQMLILANIQLAQMMQDLPKLIKGFETYLDKYPSVNSNFLNNAAWTFYEQVNEKERLEKAVKWSLASIKSQDNFMFNDTAAALYFKLKNKANAKLHAEKAIKLAKVHGEDATETESLLKKIEAL
jgi:thioredoxin-related protein